MTDQAGTNTLSLEEKNKVILREGQTLRLLALELFGDREFWVYIFQENKDVINNPNNVTSGIELIIPDSELYNIDSENPASVEKAKLTGDAVMDSF